MKDKGTKIVPSRRFWISPEDKATVWNYAQAAYDLFKAEITGMMVVLKDKDGDYIMQDPVIMKQEVSSATCEIDEDEMAIYTSKMMSKYSGQEVRFLWWHSHHNMGAFWSPTDDKNILVNKTQDFNLSLVVDLDGSYLLRLQFFEPVETYVNTEMHVLGEHEDTVPEEITKEVKELCKTKSYTMKAPGYHYNNHLPPVNNQTQLAVGGIYGMDGGYSDYDYDTVGDGKRHYNDVYKEYVDISLIKDDVMERIMKSLENLLDECYDDQSVNGTNNKSIDLWQKGKTNVDKALEEYNLCLRDFTTAKEFSDALYACWPLDFFKELKKEVPLA